MKICSVCKKEKSLDEFVKRSKSKDGRSSRCLLCQKDLNKQYKDYRKDYYRKKRAVVPGYGKSAKEKYRKTESGLLVEKKYRENNKNLINKRSAEWYLLNKERHLCNGYKWRRNNIEKCKEISARQYQREKLNPVKRFENKIRCCIKGAFRKNKFVKNGRTFDLLGFSAVELTAYLNSFLDKLCIVCNVVKITLDNSNIDHIIPIGSAVSIEEIINLNQTDNLRLICKKCNMDKVPQDVKYIKEKKNGSQGKNS